MSIVLASYNSPYFSKIPATATMIVGKHMYEYTEFDYSVFIKTVEGNRLRPGKILNWLKKNSKHYKKLR